MCVCVCVCVVGAVGLFLDLGVRMLFGELEISVHDVMKMALYITIKFDVISDKISTYEILIIFS